MGRARLLVQGQWVDLIRILVWLGHVPESHIQQPYR